MLTPKQKAILDYIQSSSGENGYAPSQQEIAKHFGFKSLGTVQNYLIRLERQGFLRKDWNAKRGMEVLRDRQFEESGNLLGSSTTTPFSPGGSLIPFRNKKTDAVPPPLLTPADPSGRCRSPDRIRGIRPNGGSSALAL